ncbi:MAG TPA: ATP-binding cassette domain-containing protein, partial [Candidatus Babeliales bacterium]|nr:ATP-binding cassette domain-containing protein [Candidatus Babeliales bacterium]
MIHITNLSHAYRNQILFENISFILQKDNRIGLVGRNGAGKSTLLKIIAREIIPDTGTISIPSNFKLGYMPQEVIIESTRSILLEAFYALPEIGPLAERHATVIHMLEYEKNNHVLLHEYADLETQLQLLNFEEVKSDIKKILRGLGFSLQDLQKPMNTLSTGWKMRVVLAKLLAQKADFYLFDEPTNHLDIVAQEWFAEFLMNASFGFLLVSHQKYFLDTLCTKIIEVENGKIIHYVGNYTAYCNTKKKTLEQLESAHAQQQLEIKNTKALIDR